MPFPARRNRLRRLLIAGPLLTGGLGLLGLLRREAAPAQANGPVTGDAGAGASSAIWQAPSPEATPIFLPSHLFAPAQVSPVSPTSELDWFEIGRSVRDLPIRAIRLGSGAVRLAIMGSIHGGWERNTERLVAMAREHFAGNPSAISPALSVYFVPTTNPDGLAAGSSSDAAWNARGVDLNRNFDTPNWSPDTYGRPGGRYGPTGTRTGAGGSSPFSEPETRAIRDFILSRKIDAVISYHSGIESVTAKDGGGGIGEPLAKEVAAATGYPYLPVWTEYKLTGQFMDWLDAVGIKGVEVDLPNPRDLDWERNLAGVVAALATLAAEPR